MYVKTSSTTINKAVIYFDFRRLWICCPLRTSKNGVGSWASISAHALTELIRRRPPKDLTKRFSKMYFT